MYEIIIYEKNGLSINQQQRFLLFRDVLFQDHEAWSIFLCIHFASTLNISGVSYDKLAVGAYSKRDLLKLFSSRKGLIWREGLFNGGAFRRFTVFTRMSR